MSQTAPWHRFCAAAADHPPATAVVLGSGLGGIAERVRIHQAVEFAAIPSWPTATVDGHQGQLLLGAWANRQVLVFCGRLHFYEGHDWECVLAPARLAASLGVRQLLLTNAAGGIRDDLSPGTLMTIAKHLDWTGNCLKANIASPYSARLRSVLSEAALRLDFGLTEGTYAAVLGPNYETPAEIRALQALGADAVGMSTAREMEAAAALGLEGAAVSCITNRAAGLAAGRLTHQEVLANSQKQAKRLGDVIEGFLLAVSERSV